ncbi:hypothetical protein BSKO_01649 [Bryopsis sp. KO-2023]|nr:hypothetical protein BSKO_01649 [Bryopsis sp. KO-2023]
MGQVISYGLTQPDVEEVAAYCGGVLSQAEISALYKRFRSLDRGRRGFLTMEVLLNIPELSINPLAHRMVRMFEGVNFKDFCRLLAPFSRRASPEMKMGAIYSVFDMDGDGVVSRDDLDLMLRQLAGTTLTDEEIAQFVDMAFKEANGSLSKQLCHDVLSNQDLSMDVDFPVHF